MRSITRDLEAKRLRPHTHLTLRYLLEDMMVEALEMGQYPPPWTIVAFEKRNKSKAFRCIPYIRLIRQINALKEVMGIGELLGINGWSVR